MNAVLAIIEGAQPKNEVEAALAIQMACTHAVTMAVIGGVGGGVGTERSMSVKISAIARLLKAFATQVGDVASLEVMNPNPSAEIEFVFLVEGPKWGDAEFLGQWLLAAAKANALWKEIFKDPSFKTYVQRQTVCYEPDFGDAAAAFVLTTT